MNRTDSLLRILTVLSLAVAGGCLGEAPHDNPIDPASDLFRNEGTLAGQVVNRAGEPISGVEVRLIPDPARGQADMLTRTGAQGRFAFRGARADSNYILQAVKDTYAVEEVEAITVQPGTTQELPSLRLNALPLVQEARLRTIHISRWWPNNDLFFLDVIADVDDADGLVDIDGVWLEIPDLTYATPLQALSAGQFGRTLMADSLPAANLQGLLGRSLRFRVRDKEGVVNHSEPLQLARIILETPVATSPKDRELLTSNQPVFSWDPFPPAFAFTYRVDVYRVEVNVDVRVESLSLLSMAEASVQLATELPTGEYFWTVTVVDAFGNESRSKEAGFRVP